MEPFENEQVNNNKEIVYKIEYNHILQDINYCFEKDRPNYNYSKENMQTMAVTIHPHFTVWLCALQLYNVGGEIMKHNAMDQVFGTQDFKEGTHSMLALKTFDNFQFYIHPII